MTILVMTKRIQGNILEAQENKKDAITSYTEALNILQEYPIQTNPFRNTLPILTAANVESIHRNLLELIPLNSPQKDYRNGIRTSLKKHLLAELDSLMKQEKWKDADRKNDKFIQYVGNRDEDRFLELDEIEKFSCDDLKQLDNIWLKNSGNRYGYSVQKKILSRIYRELGIEWYSIDFKSGNLINWSEEAYLQFAEEIGWRTGTDWLSYGDLRINWEGGNSGYRRGYLPWDTSYRSYYRIRFTRKEMEARRIILWIPKVYLFSRCAM